MPALVLAMLLLPAGRSAFAQTTPEEFKTRYDRLVSSVGVAGLGVERLDRPRRIPDSLHHPRLAETTMKPDDTERRSRDTRPQPAWRGADPATPCKAAQP